MSILCPFCVEFYVFLIGLSGAMAGISVRPSTPGSPTHVSGSSGGGRRRNGLHDVDLNTFISEEMAVHLGSAGNRKRTSAQCADVITDSPTHKRNRMIWAYLMLCMLCAAWNKSHLILNICITLKRKEGPFIRIFSTVCHMVEINSHPFIFINLFLLRSP